MCCSCCRRCAAAGCHLLEFLCLIATPEWRRGAPGIVAAKYHAQRYTQTCAVCCDAAVGVYCGQGTVCVTDGWQRATGGSARRGAGPRAHGRAAPRSGGTTAQNLSAHGEPGRCKDLHHIRQMCIRHRAKEITCCTRCCRWQLRRQLRRQRRRRRRELEVNSRAKESSSTRTLFRVLFQGLF